MEVRKRIESLLYQLYEGISEKEEAMRLALLSSIAGESIFLLGPPGVAKSLIARRLKYAYKDAKVFEYLMSRFSTPDEIFGPVSIKGLKDDKYERVIENYLPSAEVVFLDEIWKAGPSIQNALLTVLNEKKFRNGGEEITVPIKAIISASNELPSKEHDQGQGLEALWDRFLVRLMVEGIKDREKFNDMIAMDSSIFDVKSAEFKKWREEIDDFVIPDDEYKKWSKGIDQIGIPPNVFNVIEVIRNKIYLHKKLQDKEEKNTKKEENTENKIYVSDRRWRKIMRLMRTSAFLNGRNEVDLMDCFLIKHCIWNEDDEEHICMVSGFVEEAIQEYGPDVDLDTKIEEDEFQRLVDEVEKNTRKKVGVKPKIHNISNADYYVLENNYGNNYSLIDTNIIDKVTDSASEVTIFSDDLTQNIKCYITKSQEKCSINLCDNAYYSSWKEYQLQTEPIFELYKKSPSRGDYETWNRDFATLSSVLTEKREKAETYWRTLSESFYSNLFIDRKNADSHIKSKIDDVKINIDLIQEKITDICEKYKSIYKHNE